MKTTSTRRVLLAVAALVGAMTLAGSADAATKTVIAQDFNFAPTDTTVNTGDTVNWFNNGNVTHNVSFETGENLGNFNPTQTLTKVFNTAGTFAFFCNIHGAALMHGTITVQGSGTTTTSSSTSTSSTSTSSTSTSSTSTSSTSTSTTSTSTTSTSTTSTSTTSTTIAPTTTSTSTTSTVAPTTTTSTSTTSTSTTVAPTTTSTSSTSTSTSLPTTSTTLSTSQCAQLRAARAQFNAQADANEAAIRAAGFPAATQASVLAQLSAARAQGNAQIDAALAASRCP